MQSDSSMTGAVGDRQSLKLIIQIPCLNEADTIDEALRALPRHVAGFDVVEWLVIDDGSCDQTSARAVALGVHHVVRHPVNRGLAVAFMTGLEAALSLGADVIVNTDADNQYCADDIPLLVLPILNKEADLVIGARPIDETEHFSWLKKKLQRLGSWAVRVASRTEVNDAPSGFRAMSRDAAMRLNVFNSYTYTLETIIQAGLSNLVVLSVPIRTNDDLRPSRLVKSVSSYVRRSLATIIRVAVIYQPLAFFLWVGGLLTLSGIAVGGRFVYYYTHGQGDGHAQSVTLCALLLTLGALMAVLGVVADLVAVNRKLLERVLYHIQHAEQKLRDLTPTSPPVQRVAVPDASMEAPVRIR